MIDPPSVLVILGGLGWVQIAVPLYLAAGVLVACREWRYVVNEVPELRLVPRRLIPTLAMLAILISVIRVAVWPILVLEACQRWWYSRRR